jgi:hypothetical protein
MDGCARRQTRVGVDDDVVARGDRRPINIETDRAAVGRGDDLGRVGHRLARQCGVRRRRCRGRTGHVADGEHRVLDGRAAYTVVGDDGHPYERTSSRSLYSSSTNSTVAAIEHLSAQYHSAGGPAAHAGTPGEVAPHDLDGAANALCRIVN